MAKRKNGSTRDRTRAAQRQPKLRTPSTTTGISLSGEPTQQIIPNVNLINCKIVNCGTGIFNDGGSIGLDGVEIIDCGTGIRQEGGHIQGRNVTIQNREVQLGSSDSS